MAELILSPIAATVLKDLASVAVKEIGLLWGVKDELKELEDTISTIEAVLLDAEEKQVHSHQVGNWLVRLSDVVHEADDLMDELNTEALRRQLSNKVTTFFSASNPLVFRPKMGRRIRAIKKRLAAVANDRNFHLEIRPQENRVASTVRETGSFVPEDKIVGRDEDLENIVRLLLPGDDQSLDNVTANVSFVPIIGMGGLGKTALAQCAFHDKRVQEHFELKIWVCVSDVFDVKRIVQRIVESSNGGNSLGDIDMDRLQRDLRKALEGKKYILVLDDIWNEEDEKWKKLEELLLSAGAEGSRVVVTTRSRQVVAQITGTVQPYQLGVLDDDRSWSLFKMIAFRRGEEPKNPNLLGVGRAIAKKCGGVPLAIRVIGGMLSKKDSDLEYWLFVEKEFSQKAKDGIISTLQWSYDCLAPYLKHCFAYCRLFPKDFRFDVQMLIQLWMAQGFLISSGPSHWCMEDVGYSFFVDLYERSFFQEAKIDELGAIMHCKMHDLMHDLAIKVAGSECIVLDSNKGDINKKSWHVSCAEFHSLRKLQPLLVRAKNIRTILYTELRRERKLQTRESICDAVILSSMFLRTLDLSFSAIKNIPSSIGKLKHLRYLDLSYNDEIKILPNKITNLLNLQTLKLSNCSYLKELPRDIRKLVSLRHLDIDGCNSLSHIPNGLGQLTNLRTLEKYVLTKATVSFPTQSGELKELNRLNNLRGELEISNLSHRKDAGLDSKAANLDDKQYLRSLVFKWDDSDVNEANIGGYEESLEGLKPHLNLKKLCLQRYGGVKFSRWLPSLANLVTLTLSYCINCELLFPLSQFHSLKKLELSVLPSLEYITNSSCNDNYFCSTTVFLPSLQVLRLEWLPKLKGWWREYEATGGERKLPSFPCLSQLYINFCPELKSMPLYPHLDDLSLINASLKPFQQTILESTEPTSSFSPLSKLKSLIIAIIMDLECLPDWLKNLTSLNSLTISSCSRLKDLSPGISYLTSLQKLSISGCDELQDAILNVDSLLWTTLNGRLRVLSLSYFRNVEALPEGIKHISSLQQLEIFWFHSLTTIPPWISNLSSLSSLSFRYCPQLASLLEEIRSLTSLKTLEIWYCPILLKRCRRQIGEDWPKIANIPHLSLSPDPNEDNDAVGNQSRKEMELAQKLWATIN